MKELFDFNFGSFVTPKIIKIVYVLIVIMLGVMYLGFVIGAFAARQAGLGFFILIIAGPLVFLIYLALARMSLESLIATIRTAENTGELVRLAGGNAAGPAAPAPGFYPGGPTAPPAGPTAPPPNPYGQTP